MVFIKENYPDTWREFSKFIRFERANNRCEKCGVQNGIYKGFLDLELLEDEMLIHSDKVPPELKEAVRNGGYLFSEDAHFGNHEWLIKKKTKICLTTAHLDYKGGICQCKKLTGKKCAIESHVLALCQSCHLALDRQKHIAVRRKNFIKRKDAERGLFTMMDFG
jgi:hypothetical protein